MRRSRFAIRPLSLAITFSLSFSASAAINSAAIIASTLSPTCLEYKVVGICYWLLCTPFGCKVKTSTKVRHYVPDAVVSAYANTGMNPWIEMSPLGTPNPMAQAGNDGTTNHVAENNIIKFKEADVIGHPGGAALSQFASASGYVCKGATLPLVSYFLSTLDPIAWRYGVPESVYPEALIPGMREVGSLLSASSWGNVYPRSGFLNQTDDYKTGAVIAQRAGDVWGMSVAGKGVGGISRLRIAAVLRVRQVRDFKRRHGRVVVGAAGAVGATAHAKRRGELRHEVLHFIARGPAGALRPL